MGGGKSWRKMRFILDISRRRFPQYETNALEGPSWDVWHLGRSDGCGSSGQLTWV